MANVFLYEVFCVHICLYAGVFIMWVCIHVCIHAHKHMCMQYVLVLLGTVVFCPVNYRAMFSSVKV